MYVAVLSTQKNVFEEEADKLKKDLDDGKPTILYPKMLD